MDKLLSELEKKANMPDDTSNPYEKLAYPKSTINTNYLGPDGNPMMEMETPTGEMQAPSDMMQIPIVKTMPSLSAFEKPFSDNVNPDETYIPEDWSLVESQQMQDNLKKITITSKATTTLNSYEKERESLSVFTPVTLTREALKDIKKEDKEASKKTAADLHAMTYGQLADWAVSHAKVEGANPLYVRLAESMATIKNMTDARGQVPAAATYEFRRQYSDELNALQNLANEYYDSHNSFFKFSSKGRIRLELASMLKDTSKNSTISKLRKDEELFFRNKLVDTLIDQETKRKAAEDKRHELTFELDNGSILTYRDAEKTLGNGADKNRSPFLSLYKDLSLSTEEEKDANKNWNERTTRAIGELLNNKNDSFKSILTDIMQEVMDYRFDARCVEPEYLLAHSEEYFKLGNILKSYEIFNNSRLSSEAVSNALEEIKNSSPDYYKIVFERQFQMGLFYDQMKDNLTQYYGLWLREVELYPTSENKEKALQNLHRFERRLVSEEDYDNFHENQAARKKIADRETYIQDYYKFETGSEVSYHKLRKTPEYGPTLEAAQEWVCTNLGKNITRPAFIFMFKDIINTSGNEKVDNEAYNKRSLQALKDLVNGNFETIAPIFKEYTDAILNLKLPRDVLDSKKLVSNLKETFYWRSLSNFSNVVYNKGDYPPAIRDIINKILDETPQGRELFIERADIIKQLDFIGKSASVIEYNFYQGTVIRYFKSEPEHMATKYKFWKDLHADKVFDQQDVDSFYTQKQEFMKLAEPFFEK